MTDRTRNLLNAYLCLLPKFDLQGHDNKQLYASVRIFFCQTPSLRMNAFIDFSPLGKSVDGWAIDLDKAFFVSPITRRCRNRLCDVGNPPFLNASGFPSVPSSMWVDWNGQWFGSVSPPFVSPSSSLVSEKEQIWHVSPIRSDYASSSSDPCLIVGTLCIHYTRD
jgi:hypothetical protein